MANVLLLKDVLLISTDAHCVEVFERISKKNGLETDIREDFVQGTEALMNSDYRAFALDLDADKTGCLSFVKLLNELRDKPRIVIFSRGMDKQTEMEARSRGITMFLNKSEGCSEIEKIVKKEEQQEKA
jgi:DNA-binding NtrC family response regulator